MTTYKIAGMSCQGCVGSVTRALTVALPEMTVTVQLDGGLVQVQGPHDPKDVERAIEDAGFDFLGLA